MTNEEYYRTQLHEIDVRLTHSEHIVTVTPDDCASAKANLREYLREDLDDMLNTLRSRTTVLDEPVRETLLDRVHAMQLRRRTAVGNLR